MLKRWERFVRFFGDGRMLSNNATERALRGRRKSWLFAGFERCTARAAAMRTLLGTAKFNDVDPLA
jgi:transposase